MTRNLDLTALRSFVAIADLGGVTRAAGHLNLTQSAVSMQLKRLEDMLALQLFDRKGRKLALTSAGDQLLGYARRLLDLNDEVWGRLTEQTYQGEVVLGVPKDIVQCAIPQVLRRFAAAYPRMQVQLVSSVTTELKDAFARGECDLILTTEDDPDPGATLVSELPLGWYGAPGGRAWRERPLRLAYSRQCKFRKPTHAALDAVGIAWDSAVESDSLHTVEASVRADLAVYVQMDGMPPADFERIRHNGELPDIGRSRIYIYGAGNSANPAIADLAEMVREAYAPAKPIALRA